MKCECGNDLTSTSKFCTKCGKKNEFLATESNGEVEIELVDDVFTDVEFEEVEIQKNNVEIEQIVPTNTQEPNQKKNKSIWLFVVLLALLGGVGVGYSYIKNSTLEINDVDYTNYPYVIFTVTNNDNTKHDDFDFELYQDGILVTDVTEEGRGKFSVILDSQLVKGDTTVLEIKKTFSTDDEDFKIRQTVNDTMFKTSTLIDENFPEITILTEIPEFFESRDISDNLYITVDSTDYNPLQIKYNNDGTAEIKFNIDGSNRVADFKFTYNMADDNFTFAKESSITFEPLETNLYFYWQAETYTEYPDLSFTISADDQNTQDVTANLNADYFTITDSEGKTIPSLVTQDSTGLITVAFNIDDIQNWDEPIYVNYMDNYYSGAYEYYTDSYFLSEMQYWSTFEYDPTHRYEVVMGDVTWQDAFDIAISKGGYLVNITTQEELDAVVEQIKATTSSTSNQYWTGGYYDYDMGEYYWKDEYYNSVIGIYDFWMEGEPSWTSYDENLEVDIIEDAVALFYRSAENKWVLNDTADDLLYYYPGYSGSLGYIIEYDY